MMRGHISINMAMLISGRVLQGFGGSGINFLVETVICDLVPLRERGNYMALVFGMISVGTALGTLFGGLIVSYSTWRWTFCIALPVGGPALVLLVAFLHVNYDKSSTLATKLENLDWLGNIVFVGASSSVLIALSWAGDEYSWPSFRVVVPLVLGIVALAGFIVLEGSRFIANPMMPLNLFANRTSAATFALTFLHGIVTMWALYFLPVYFQGVLSATPYRSGVMLLPNILALVPFALHRRIAAHQIWPIKAIIYRRVCSFGRRIWPILAARPTLEHGCLGRVPDHRVCRRRSGHTCPASRSTGPIDRQGYSTSGGHVGLYAPLRRDLGRGHCRRHLQQSSGAVGEIGGHSKCDSSGGFPKWQGLPRCYSQFPELAFGKDTHPGYRRAKQQPTAILAGCYRLCCCRVRRYCSP